MRVVRFSRNLNIIECDYERFIKNVVIVCAPRPGNGNDQGSSKSPDSA